VPEVFSKIIAKTHHFTLGIGIFDAFSLKNRRRTPDAAGDGHPTRRLVLGLAAYRL
jgi:hypothetical protein